MVKYPIFILVDDSGAANWGLDLSLLIQQAALHCVEWDIWKLYMHPDDFKESYIVASSRYGSKPFGHSKQGKEQQDETR